MDKISPLLGAILIAILIIIPLYFFLPGVNKKEKIIEITNGFSIEKVDENYYENLVEKLIECESSHKELAINTKDRDGTASFSYLQWKPETFREYAIKYGVIGEKAIWNWIMTIIWDYKTNKYLGIQILKNEPEKAKNLWPICWKKIKK